MTLTASLVGNVRTIWDRQLQHPFVQALGDGTLPRDNFQFYILQDALFLDTLARTFGYAATLTPYRSEMERYGELLLGTIRDEQALHRAYANQFGLTSEQMAATPMAPTTYAYTRHLLATAATGTLPELLSAILPCFWIYAEVARHFTSLGPPAETHPYRDWLATYGSPDFEETAAWLRAALDHGADDLSASALQRLQGIFLISSRYEYMFWDMAWRREEWPI
jgi:thiaminase (transcriptional activator TenA)